MKIVVVGAGYVGLVSGTCLADFGHEVICIDKDVSKIEILNSGKTPIYEPGLDKLIENNIQKGRLKFSSDLGAAMQKAEVVFIAVGTPPRSSDGGADLTFVYAAAEEIAHHTTGYIVVVTKSTVPVGTGDEIENIMSKSISSDDFAVISNPEFLREGAAITDFKSPDRVVIGTDDLGAEEVMRELYYPLSSKNVPFLYTSRRSAELIKYSANAYLATKITFINEVADLCEKMGANVEDVATGIGLDTRIGGRFLRAGPGYGGSCFPKDTLALVRTAASFDVPLTVVDSVIRANSARKERMVKKIIEALNGDVSSKCIAVLGLAFKANTDDMRAAPSLTIIPALQDQGAKIRAYDPEAMSEAQTHLPEVEMMNDAYMCVESSDALVILTEWDEFKNLDLKRIKANLNAPIIVDLRNLFSPDFMKSEGFVYHSVGR